MQGKKTKIEKAREMINQGIKMLKEEKVRFEHTLGDEQPEPAKDLGAIIGAMTGPAKGLSSMIKELKASGVELDLESIEVEAEDKK